MRVENGHGQILISVCLLHGSHLAKFEPGLLWWAAVMRCEIPCDARARWVSAAEADTLRCHCAD